MARRSRAPLIFGIVVVTGIAGVLSLYRSSPGELSSVHASVIGASILPNCRKCHAKAGLTEGCLSCHNEIRGQMNTKTGFHGFLLKKGPMACQTCHSEHHGAAFKLVNARSWENKPENDFRHEHTAFHLTGKHDGLACEKCHKPNAAKPFSLAGFPDHPRADTKLGLSQECISCHKDPHAGGRSPACSNCHSQTAWKPAPGFNHDKFFPLNGGHEKVSCAKCHEVTKTPAVGLKLFGAVKGTRCADCHATPHRVTFHFSCENCHTRSAVPWSSANARFPKAEHAVTGFPLSMPHAKATCASCHNPREPYAERFSAPGAGRKPRSPHACEVCHKDAHDGQFVKSHSKCTDCHAETAFKPSKFSAKKHDTFPLKGGHAAVACNFCHKGKTDSGARIFVGTSRACAACHEDEHRGQFAENGKTKCERCHMSATAWSRLDFNHNRDATFKLDQAHAGVACASCHPKVRAREGGTMVLYKPIKAACKNCHGFDK